jgi:hypothetical protein
MPESMNEGSLLEHEPLMHKDGFAPHWLQNHPGSCAPAQTIGDSVAYGSARMGTLAYILGQLSSEGLPTEPPPKPTPKPNTTTPSVPLRDRKKELRQIEHRKRLKNHHESLANLPSE